MCWNIRGSGAAAISSDNASGADNQQERPIAEMRAESSETIRRTSARVSDEEMVPSAWRHAGVALLIATTHSIVRSRKTTSEIPCRVSQKLAPEWSDSLVNLRLISGKPTRSHRRDRG